VRRVIKLSSNENSVGASPNVRLAVRRAALNAHRYPDSCCNALRSALAAKYDLDPAGLSFGAGSDEIFRLAAQAYLEPGEAVLQPQFGYASWAIAARAAGGEVVFAPERGFTVDIDALLERVNAKTKIVFLANPANPTGTWLPFSEIERLHRHLPEEVLLVQRMRRSSSRAGRMPVAS
jgi:histidinol-phosphate aminotransferase